MEENRAKMGASNDLPVLEDINVIVAGQGGDGSLTVITLLAELLRDSGHNVYTERDVLSRIRGGHAAATMRAFIGDRYCIGSKITLLVAFDEEAIEKNLRHLDSDSVIVFDDSSGKLPEDMLPKGATLYAAPFNRIAMRTMRRELYKNSIAFGVVGRLLGLEDEKLRDIFKKRFQRMGQVILEYNLEALTLGFHMASERGIEEGQGLYRVEHSTPEKHLLITGNESVALGFLVAGGRFFTGYPITPSSEILENLQKWLPQYGGVARQTEDELSGINMAIGAALTGTRTMTATSGPGLSLMQEGFGQTGSGEIPLVIVDCQRSGPSTGMPTKPEQSDFNLMVFGGHGDFPRIVLSPGHPEDCFYLAVEATNLADTYQCPVIIAMDQAISQNIATVDPYDMDNLAVTPGKRITAEEIEKQGYYKRYELTEDNISPVAIPGTKGGMSLVTGNEHNEWGLVSTDPENRINMMEKRRDKIEQAKEVLPKARRYGDPNASVGIIGTGFLFGVILEAMEMMNKEGMDMQFLQPRTLWPVLDDILEFIRERDRVYVVEQNGGAQLAHLLMHQGAPENKIISIIRYDGIPYRPAGLVKDIMTQESQLAVSEKKEAQIQ